MMQELGVKEVGSWIESTLGDKVKQTGELIIGQDAGSAEDLGG